MELRLDLAILEDGLCVGPDEGGMIEGLQKDLEVVRNTARSVLDALQRGAQRGQIFEILQPLARLPRRDEAGKRIRYAGTLSSGFANMAINRLTHSVESHLLSWVERTAQSTPLRLHRPG